MTSPAEQTAGPAAVSPQTDGEEVVLLDGSGHAIGAALKTEVHHGDTPLHLAFSCYVFRADGCLLVTRRALSKLTFPGVWSNSLCGHPAPGETLEAAVRRRARAELGIEVAQLRLVLPRFGYRAEMGGVVELELCPVFVGTTTDTASAPEPVEVAAVRWVPWDVFSGEVLAEQRVVSSWCREQVAALVELGDVPLRWPTADSILLPAAARPT